MHITYYPALTKVDQPEARELEWAALVHLLGFHTQTHTKESMSLFGAHVLRIPYRKDENVEAVTAAVFDVDDFSTDDPEAELAECRARLLAADLAQHWYTSHSHSPTKPSWRLLVPFTQALAPEHWKKVRLALVERFAIPVDKAKCSGTSHAYFLPSCPVGSSGEIITIDGLTLDPLAYTLPTNFREHLHPDLRNWSPPADPTEPVNLKPLKARLRGRMDRMEDSDRRKVWVDRCLNGKALEDDGTRNTAACVVAGIIAYALPEQPIGVLYEILRPSVDAMVCLGSKVNEAKVRRMLESALRNKAAADKLDADLDIGSWAKLSQITNDGEPLKEWMKGRRTDER